MNKEQFLAELRDRLSYLPESETEKPLAFYAESIDDRVEDGMTEEEAVAALGSIDDIVREIEASLPLSTIVKRQVRVRREKREKSGNGPVWILLAVLGFPLWFPLLVTAAALVLTVYIVVWAVIISLFAVLLSLVVSGIALVVYAVGRIATLGFWAALMVLGAAAVLIGLAVVLEKPMRGLAKALASLTGRFWHWIKLRFVGKGGDSK